MGSLHPTRHRLSYMVLKLIVVITCSACLLELARIIDLEVDTDDKSDPSCRRVPKHFWTCDSRLANDGNLDGVVVFLILSVAEEVCAIICASLPVVIPHVLREYRRERTSHKTSSSYPSNPGSRSQLRSMIRGFQKLGGRSGDRIYPGEDLAGEHSDRVPGSIQLDALATQEPPRFEDHGNGQIVVKREYEVTLGDSDPHAI